MTGANYTTGYKVENGKSKSSSFGTGLESGVYLKINMLGGSSPGDDGASKNRDKLETTAGFDSF
jgi:hypothetical protein